MKKWFIIFLFLLAFGGVGAGFLYSSKIVVENDPCPKDLHYSYFSSKTFFEDAYKNAPAVTSPKDIKGVLLNHHLLAPHLIAATISSIATTSPITVLLVSPNHFSAGTGGIISSLYKWDTPYGVLQSDCETVSELQAAGALSVEEMPFEKEHGIYGIVPFIKKSLPNAKIIPLIIRNDISETELNVFVETLFATLGDKALVVGSFDFSHYLPDLAAQFHDQKSLSVIKDFDYAGLQSMDTDSIPGLEIVMRYMEKEGAKDFHLIANTNSSLLLHDPKIEETTSYIDGAFSVGSAVPDSTTTILAFGDMMLDRNVRKKIIEQGATFPFLPLKRFLIGSDVVVANAEGPFTANPSVTLNKINAPLQFTFNPATLPTLKKLGLTLLSQANNHAENFGLVGLHQSEKNIENAGLNWFGDPLNSDLHSFTETIRGQKITFVGYHQFVVGGLKNVLEEIKSAHESGSFVVIYPHWGIEYNPNASLTQTDLAHAMIDAGADLILGSHPHVIEPIEIYKDKAIFYSLGNFIFDQAQSGPTAEGLSVGISLTKDRVSYFLFPLDIKSEQASLMPYAGRVKIFETLAQNSSVPEQLKADINKGIFTLSR